MYPEYTAHLINSQNIELGKKELIITLIGILFLVSLLINLLLVLHIASKNSKKDSSNEAI